MALPTFRTVIDMDGVEFDWLASITATATHERKEIGRAVGQLIRREQIRPTFYEEMEAASQGSRSLAFDLFDRYGCLKREFIYHSVKKGSGVWGEELNAGNILHVDFLSVDAGWRRHRIGTRLFTNILESAQLRSGTSFVFVWPTQLNSSEVCMSLKGKSKREQQAIFHAALVAAIAFYRSIGFRRVGDSVWFCMVTDKNHPSHKLAASEDFDPPQQSDNFTDDGDDDGDDGGDFYGLTTVIDRTKRFKEFEQKLPVHFGLSTIPDLDCMSSLARRLTVIPATDDSWRSIDSRGNNILHLAACLSKPESVGWIMQHSALGAELAALRNHDGYTPVEALEAQLEANRVKRELFCGTTIASVSDDFRGFPDKAVHCLMKLKGPRIFSTEEKTRIKGGCTCGECLAGVISPRMSATLEFHAECIADLIRTDEGMHVSYDKYLPHSVRNRLENDEDMLEGFTNLFGHIAGCLRAKEIPTERNVLRRVHESREDPLHTKDFLRRGGTVAAAMKEVLDFAFREDEMTGNGEYMETFRDEVELLKKCRNDHEFGYVRHYCAGGGGGGK